VHEPLQAVGIMKVCLFTFKSKECNQFKQKISILLVLDPVSVIISGLL